MSEEAGVAGSEAGIDCLSMTCILNLVWQGISLSIVASMPFWPALLGAASWLPWGTIVVDGNAIRMEHEASAV